MLKPRKLNRRRMRILVVVSLLGAVGAMGLASVEPSNDRDWMPEQAVLPEITFEGDIVRIRNVRDFRHHADGSVTPAYDDRTYDLRKIERVWFGVSPFGKSWRGPAHVFLSFGFSDSQHVAISVEARKEVGEEYSIWKGLLRRYELMYVIADERDVIPLRTEVWGDPVHLYPTRATPEQARTIFLRMLERAEALRRQPVFYNTVTNNCTSNIVELVNEVATRRIRFGPDLLLPGYSDARAHRLGLLDTGLPLEEARRAFLVNDRVAEAIDEEDFSLRIRAGLASDPSP